MWRSWAGVPCVPGRPVHPLNGRWGLVYGSGIGMVEMLCGMAWDGRLSQPAPWERWALLIVPALAGVWLGHRLAHRVPVARLRQAICALLVVSGSVLVAKALG